MRMRTWDVRTDELLLMKETRSLVASQVGRTADQDAAPVTPVLGDDLSVLVDDPDLDVRGELVGLP